MASAYYTIITVDEKTQTVDLGSPVMIEVEFKTAAPFGTDAYFDPSTFTITVEDENDNTKVDAAALVKSAVGKYYYYLQTASDWNDGQYKITVESSDGTYTDITIKRKAFRLL